MTDVFKKINDILKEKKDDYDDMYRIFKKGGDKQLAYTTHEILKVIRSIRQMIGEMEKEYNDGWIPCSERLPENKDLCWLTNVWSDGTRHVTYDFYIKGGGWYDTVSDSVLAWMPINKPAPYKPKGENNA